MHAAVRREDLISIEHATGLEMPAVYRMVHDAYVDAGYCLPQPDGQFRHYRHLDADPSTVVLVAYSGGELSGTNSWKPDSESKLHTDIDFSEATEKVRNEGRRLGASWRIVTRSWCASAPRIVTALIARTMQEMLEFGIETALFTFAQKHERFYKRVLRMETVARKRVEHDLLGVDAVLMRLDREQCEWRSSLS